MPDLTYLDWPFFDDSHRDLSKEIRTWAEDEIAPLQHEEPRGNDALDKLTKTFIQKLGEGGWLKYCVPVAFGTALNSVGLRNILVFGVILGVIGSRNVLVF